MTRAASFPAHPTALVRCADALAGCGLWHEAVEFGERAAALRPLEVGDRMELAWRLLRTGRPESALSTLADLPDDAHPLLPQLRAAAVAIRDRRPEDLAELLRVLAQRTTGIGLRMVVLAALAVGDRATALDAASRYLAVVDGDHPEMRQLMAVEQAIEGDMPAAVASAECAAAGRPGDVDGPAREINDELQRRGQSVIASRFLADGYLRTRRPVYGDLLAAALPWRLRHRNRILIAGLGMMLVGIGLAVGLASGVGFILLLILGVGGALVMAGSALMRAPGANHAQTQSIVQAHVLYRSRLGASDVLLPAIGSGAGFFAWITMMNRGDRDSVPPGVLLGLAGASVAVGAVVAVVVWQVRRRRRRASAEPEPVASERCRCWETNLAGGPPWERYLTEHLEQVATDEALGTVLRRCPTTDKMWLHVPSRSLAVSVQLPDEPEPEPDYPVGHYL